MGRGKKWDANAKSHSQWQAICRRALTKATREGDTIRLFEAENFTRALLREVRDTVTLEGRVILPGLGILSVRERKARAIVDISTKQRRELPAMKSVHFRMEKGWAL